MFSKNDNIPEKINIIPPVAEHYELRVIIWSVAGVKLVDDALFTGEKYSDIYVKGLYFANIMLLMNNNIYLTLI